MSGTGANGTVCWTRPMPDRRSFAACAVLAALWAFTVFWPALDFQFLNYDDDQLVLANEPVARGLSGETARWAFTTRHFKTWQPLVWVSYLADASLSGLDPHAFHRTNVLLHALNALLVFAILASATGRARAPVIAALLFAAHPLQVESVAWVAERKGLLAATFMLLAALAYVRRGAGPAVLALMALALMAKGTAVVLPLLLLALDFWPLGRLERERPAALVREKAWLFALAAASGLWTFAVFGQGGALPGLDRVSPAQRLSNTLLSPLAYLRKAAWPADLRIPYRHAPAADPLVLAASAAALLALAAAAWRARARAPQTGFGLAWFVAALLPVIGLVPVGHHWIADRYAYVPLIGLAALVAFTLDDLLPAALALALPVALVLMSAFACSLQLAHWRSSATLFAHTLELDPDNVTAHAHLAKALASTGQLEPALAHCWRAVQLEPATARHHYGLGVVLMMSGRFAEAAHVFGETQKLVPGEAAVAYNLGYCLTLTGKGAAAIAAYERAASLDPRDPAIQANLGAAYQAAGRLDDARARYRSALGLDPAQPVARRNLAALEKR